MPFVHLHVVSDDVQDLLLRPSEPAHHYPVVELVVRVHLRLADVNARLPRGVMCAKGVFIAQHHQAAVVGACDARTNAVEEARKQS